MNQVLKTYVYITVNLLEKLNKRKFLQKEYDI